MICVLYIYGHNYDELAEIAIPVLKKYCERHSYHLELCRTPPNEKGTYTYIKIERARKMLDKYDAVLVLEGDMLVTNTTVKIESFLKNDKDFYACKDVNGINTGSFIARSSEWTKYLLDNVWDKRNVFADEQNFFEMYWSSLSSRAHILPHPSINSIPYEEYAPSYGYIGYQEGETRNLPTEEQGRWVAGNFVCHCPGKTLEERKTIFEKIKEAIVYE